MKVVNNPEKGFKSFYRIFWKKYSLHFQFSAVASGGCLWQFSGSSLGSFDIGFNQARDLIAMFALSALPLMVAVMCMWGFRSYNTTYDYCRPHFARLRSDGGLQQGMLLKRRFLAVLQSTWKQGLFCLHFDRF